MSKIPRGGKRGAPQPGTGDLATFLASSRTGGARTPPRKEGCPGKLAYGVKCNNKEVQRKEGKDQ